MDLEKFLADHVRGSTQHRRFYHFTDKRNLESIRKHGLLSTRELKRLRLFESVVTGGDANSLQSDRQNGTDQFVCLCFTNNHPMAYVASIDDRNLDRVYLEIDPDIVKLPGVMITNAASNQAGVVPVLAGAALNDLDLPVIYTWTDWTKPEIHARLKAAEKYEILVPKCVPSGYITKGL